MSVVAGPVAALVATAKRIGWTIESATAAKDNLMQSWKFAADSLVAIASAVANSVRRWRLNRILTAIPTAAPSAADCFTPNAPSQIFDFSRIIKPMVKGKGHGKKAETEWNPTWAASLACVFNGGQWLQVRKCNVAKWELAYNSCQLCFA